MSTSQVRFRCFAATAPGLESLCAQELRGLGVRGRVEAGGVAWSGDWDSMARANLWLRTASRVLVRVGEFHASAFHELERQAKRMEWARFIGARSRFALRVTCKKSKLYHSDAVAERIAAAIVRAVPTATPIAAADDGDAADPSGPGADAQLVIVRLFHDTCTISADTSGALLHFRGYRQQLAKAPLRETLAAAVLLGAGWTGDTPLTDPMCGSGTIPIEAAMIARRIAPGGRRSFAFLRWPSADVARFDGMVAEARRSELPRSPVAIAGSDRDAGAIEASRANAERAGVSADIVFETKPISAIGPGPAGLVVSNPPYGVRIGEADRLRNLYAQIGNVLRRDRPGSTLALLSADATLERATGLGFEERFRTSNGGIPVHLVVAAVKSADAPARPARARPAARA